MHEHDDMTIVHMRAATSFVPIGSGCGSIHCCRTSETSLFFFSQRSSTCAMIVPSQPWTNHKVPTDTTGLVFKQQR